MKKKGIIIAVVISVSVLVLAIVGFILLNVFGVIDVIDFDFINKTSETRKDDDKDRKSSEGWSSIKANIALETACNQLDAKGNYDTYVVDEDENSNNIKCENYLCTAKYNGKTYTKKCEGYGSSVEEDIIQNDENSRNDNEKKYRGDSCTFQSKELLDSACKKVDFYGNYVETYDENKIGIACDAFLCVYIDMSKYNTCLRKCNGNVSDDEYENVQVNIDANRALGTACSNVNFDGDYNSEEDATYCKGFECFTKIKGREFMRKCNG